MLDKVKIQQVCSCFCLIVDDDDDDDVVVVPLRSLLCVLRLHSACVCVLLSGRAVNEQSKIEREREREEQEKESFCMLAPLTSQFDLYFLE